ncbi:MAG: hypothetical protein IKX71_04745 [Bacteroidales bacterium]|nr:hypothetical protein [Bacteroidales bacterium]
MQHVASRADVKQAQINLHNQILFAYFAEKIRLMAYYIKPAPVLEGKSAQHFREKVEVNPASTEGRIDFAKQAASAKRILDNSKVSIF